MPATVPVDSGHLNWLVHAAGPTVPADLGARSRARGGALRGLRASSHRIDEAAPFVDHIASEGSPLRPAEHVLGLANRTREPPALELHQWPKRSSMGTV